MTERGILIKNILTDVILFFALLLVLFVFIPSFHISTSPSEFYFLNVSVYIKVVNYLALMLFLPLLFLVIILHLTGLSGIARRVLVFLLSWATISGLLFPLVHSTGMVEASEAPVNYLHLAFVVTISILFSTLVTTKLKFIPIVFCIVILLTSLFTSLPIVLDVYKRQDFSSGILKVSREKNIFVISFDGIPGYVAKNVIDENYELAKTFKDFTFYANVVSPSPATHASIRSELFGNRNYHKIATTDAEVDSSLNLDKLLINRIENSYTYGSYNHYNLNAETRVIPLSFTTYSEKEIIYQHIYWLKLLLARIGTPILTRITNYSYLDTIVFQNLVESELEDELSARLANYVGPDWKRAFTRHINDYYYIVNNLEAIEDGLSVRMMHFVHSHYPVDFDENSRFRGDDLEWHNANQNYQGLYNQCIGELTQLGNFIDKLKKLGIYDNSLIVFKSDHGKPANYYNFYPNDLQINGNALWGVDRYMPLLMIKDFSVNNESIFFNEDLVTLGDLAKTLSNAAMMPEVDNGYFPGVDLLGEYFINNSPFFYIEVVKGPESTFQFHDHKTLELKRAERKFHEILTDSSMVTLYSPTESQFTCIFTLSEVITFGIEGESDSFLKKVWSVNELNQKWTNDQQAELQVRLATDEINNDLKIIF